MDENFKKILEKAVAEGNDKIKEIQHVPSLKINPIIKLSLFDKIKGVKGAFARLYENGVFNKESYCSEKEAIERTVCCTTCTDSNGCPYCGCKIKLKRFLNTENCPTPETYSHLKKFPPRLYWDVTKEITSVFITARNEKYVNKTIEKVLENSTGNIEVWVGLDRFTCDIIEDPRVNVFKDENIKGKRSILNKMTELSTGKYLLFLHSHCYPSMGFDTLLKCACEDDTIAWSQVSELDEETWEPKENKWGQCYLDDNFSWRWKNQPNLIEKTKKLLPTECLTSIAWMINKETFIKLGKFDEKIGQHGFEEAEWVFKMKDKGRFVLRTDLCVGHLFRDNFPYELDNVNTDYLKELYKQNG